MSQHVRKGHSPGCPLVCIHHRRLLQIGNVLRRALQTVGGKRITPYDVSLELTAKWEENLRFQESVASNNPLRVTPLAIGGWRNETETANSPTASRLPYRRAYGGYIAW